MPEAYWRTPEFIHTGYFISIVWGIIFLIALGASLFRPYLDQMASWLYHLLGTGTCSWESSLPSGTFIGEKSPANLKNHEPGPPNNPGLYVHIPFCKTKCPYCDFYSITDDTLISAYLAALDAEARLYRDQFPAFDSLFLGGGTPSLARRGATCRA